MDPIQEAMTTLRKQYGPGVVMRHGDEPEEGYEVISTGSYSLDLALGIGGLPRGRIVELFGPESSGKSTISLHVIAEAQKQGLKCLYVDVEHAFDAGYARAIGVNTDDLYISQPDSGEQALEVMDMFVRTGEMAVVVLDSVASLVPKAELEGDMGDAHVGLQARLMGQGLRKITANVSKSKTLVIFVNQLREKVGGFSRFGTPEITPGGRALKFFSSVRLKVKIKEMLKDGGGRRTVVEVVKNKCSLPSGTAEFSVVWGRGIDRESELIDVGETLGVIAKSGSWYHFGGQQLGQGRDKAGEFVFADPQLHADIESEIKKALGQMARQGQ